MGANGKVLDHSAEKIARLVCDTLDKMREHPANTCFSEMQRDAIVSVSVTATIAVLREGGFIPF